MDKFSVRIMFVALVVFIVMSVGFCSNAKADDSSDTQKLALACSNKAVIDGLKWGATYGGAILGIGSLISVGLAPSGMFTLTTGTIVIASNTITGTLIGAGASLATRISDEYGLKVNPLYEACKARAKLATERF